MKTVVLKFGGTSVGSIDRIKRVCKIIASYKKKNFKVLAISSAMSGVTNDLVNKSKLISNNFDKAEYDTLVSTGEQASCALIAGRLKHMGFRSRSWMSWQLPILTEGPYSGARISKIVVKELNKYLKSGGIPIITGFQGVNSELRLTTIGRSGSDASGIMLAKFIKAEECIIYTDVDGVYTTDPRQYKNAKKIKKIFYDEMLEMASLGSKVMQPTSVQDAKLNKIDIQVKSSFVKKSGTIITGFQGINSKSRLNTIGRSGSDATAIMFAKFLNADECIIYTDVDGVYTTDPRDYKNAKKIKKIFYDEMLEMASLGSKVMQPTSVQDAKLNKINIEVKSSFVKKPGTLITGYSKSFSDQIITGISSTKNDAKITIIGVKDRPGVAACIFKPLSHNLINVDMVVQNISLNGKETD